MNHRNDLSENNSITLLKLPGKVRSKTPVILSLLRKNTNINIESFLKNIEVLMDKSKKRKQSFGIFALILDCFYKNKNMPLSKDDLISELSKEYLFYENFVITTRKNKKNLKVTKENLRQVIQKALYNNKNLIDKIGNKITIKRITLLNTKNQILNRIFHPDILNEKNEVKILNEKKEEKLLNKNLKNNFEIVIIDSTLNKIALTNGINLFSENDNFDEEDQKQTAPQSIEKTSNKTINSNKKTDKKSIQNRIDDELNVNNPESKKFLYKKRNHTKSERNSRKNGITSIRTPPKLKKQQITTIISQIDKIISKMKTKIIKFILKNNHNVKIDFKLTEYFEQLINKIIDKHSELKKTIKEFESKKGKITKMYKKKCISICRALLNHINLISEKFDFKKNKEIILEHKNEEGVIILSENSSENSFAESKNEPYLIDEIQKLIKKIISIMK